MSYNLIVVCVSLQINHSGQSAGRPGNHGGRRRTLPRGGGERHDGRERDQPSGLLEHLG